MYKFTDTIDILKAQLLFLMQSEHVPGCSYTLMLIFCHLETRRWTEPSVYGLKDINKAC